MRQTWVTGLMYPPNNQSPFRVRRAEWNPRRRALGAGVVFGTSFVANACVFVALIYGTLHTPSISLSRLSL